MSFISKSTIAEVNSRIDAISIVNDYVRLDKKSGRWWGRCPFHAGGQEKTPSFKVDPDLKTYHCFGCGKGGGIIGFVMEMDKITYPEAIKVLARKMGIEIVYEEGGTEAEPDYSSRDELLELYRRCTGTFQHFLLEKPQGKSALQYLEDRKVSAQMIERFRLGFAPADRDFLHHFLTQKGYSADFLEKSGLFSSRYKTMPLFTGRLMFPIADRQGRVVAFGGRAMPGVLQSDGKEPPKYINSPELETYKKGQTLYAFDLALPLIRQTKSVYIAEGYMDVIAMHQAGVENAVAPLGTAFTDEQASLLRRWADKIILIFDTDEAGQKAAYKAILTCRKNGLYCEVAHIQKGLEMENVTEDVLKFKDPAEILQNFGPDILKKIVKCTINDFEYLIIRGRSQFGMDLGGKNRALAFLFPYLDALDSEVERDDCITLAADTFGVDRGAVQKDYSKRKAANGSWRQEVQEKKTGSEESKALPGRPISMNEDIHLLTVVSANMELYPEFRTTLEIKEIDDPAAKELFIAMEECFIHDESGVDSLLARISDESLRNFIVGRGSSGEFKGENASRRMMEDGIKAVKKKRLKRRLAEIGAKLRKGERASKSGGAAKEDNDDINIEELLSEKMFIDSQIRKLEGR